ncbi:methylenetetrahydrofolate reductase [Amnibacterium sp. CER49]|uniref:methylenetetrahydrofolate reductase n=1 Tax=Amnibacterium sp. CER49 TaxID=3039161 RepID=UPI0024474492|nr:methylenetetrahydrofolate reductase [Amnibacterium sp. CER49]MDH2444835.1 methylenetetrahydrofolate reductase [Amnibacterium sp. CER49]
MADPRVTHSFELYPPRSAASGAALPGVIDTLAATQPEFLSVTYGASGSTVAASLDLVRTVVERTPVDVMAHLTCAGRTPAEITATARRLLDLGARRFLAVRGDAAATGAPTGLRTAAELVQLLHRVQAERREWSEATVPDALAPEQQEDRARVAVAAFVNGHPGARSRAGSLDALLAKQVAGAELAITQLFFHADDYAAFVARARAWGITIPIVPGLLPVTSLARLRRMLELSGEDEPTDLAIALEVEPTEEGRHEIGVAAAVRFAEALLAAGAPALHLYTLNRTDAVLDVLDRLGLGAARAAAASKEPK